MKYVNVNLDYLGANIYNRIKNALGTTDFYFSVEEIGTTNFILAHVHYDGSTDPDPVVISNNRITLGSHNAYGTQIINGYSGDGSAGTLRFVGIQL